MNRNLFIEILPLTGTNPAAVMIKELVLSNRLLDTEAQRAVILLPYYIRMPSEKLLISWEDMLAEISNIRTRYVSWCVLKFE